MTPGAFDYAVLVVIAMAAIFEWRWYWPRCAGAIRAGDRKARGRIYRNGVIAEWTVTLYVLGLWVAKSRPWGALWLSSTSPLRLSIGCTLAAIVIALLLMQARKVHGLMRRRPEVVTRLREKLAFADPLMPETDEERHGFWLLSVTAGVCEEIVFRGFLIWLIGTWLGLVAAVIISSILFGCAHVYLGEKQVPRTAVVGLALALIVVTSGSLWPAIIIHAALDVNSGELAFRVKRAPVPAISQVTPSPTS